MKKKFEALIDLIEKRGSREKLVKCIEKYKKVDELIPDIKNTFSEEGISYQDDLFHAVSLLATKCEDSSGFHDYIKSYKKDAVTKKTVTKFLSRNKSSELFSELREISWDILRTNDEIIVNVENKTVTCSTDQESEDTMRLAA